MNNLEMAFSNTALKAKINSIKMMKYRGFDISDEEMSLTLQPLEKVKEYYQTKTHMVTLNSEVRINYDPINSKVKIILNSNEKVEKSIENEYINIPSFIYNSVNIERRSDDIRHTLSNLYFFPETREWTMVYFSSDLNGKNFGESEFRSITSVCEICKIYNLIIISSKKPTPAANAKIQELKILTGVTINEKQRNIQFFEETELLLCIVEHEFAARYRKVSLEQLKEYYGNDTFRAANIPAIPVDDKMVKFYGWKIGEFLEEFTFGQFINSMIDSEKFFRRIIPSTKEKKGKK